MLLATFFGVAGPFSPSNSRTERRSGPSSRPFRRRGAASLGRHPRRGALAVSPAPRRRFAQRRESAGSRRHAPLAISSAPRCRLTQGMRPEPKVDSSNSPRGLFGAAVPFHQTAISRMGLAVSSAPRSRFIKRQRVRGLDCGRSSRSFRRRGTVLPSLLDAFRITASWLTVSPAPRCRFTVYVLAGDQH